jgi:uncharacterized protein
MSGEKDLSILIRSLAPVLDTELYTFATVTEEQLKSLSRPIGIFREAEGISVICTKAQAEARHLKSAGAFKKISLTIHSSLAAVGLTARVSAALASRGIACNVVAAFHHDHLFVPADRAEEAREILSGLK